MNPFSALDRTAHLESLAQERVNILIIGGGITGAGILLDGVNRGFKVALLEKKDFASGTSSRSTKLIHGGLRYLKQRQFKLVKETGKERAILFNNARHLVERNKMLLPIIKGGSLGAWTTSIALWLYDRIANVSANEHKIMLSKDRLKRMEPLLLDEGLKGGGLYFEYKVDDARLTLEIIKKAVENGGTAVNYTEVQSFTYASDGKINGVSVLDKISQTNYTIEADFIVNATGPWSDRICSMDETQKISNRIVLSKGVHIVVPHSKLPLKQSIYFDVLKDKRMAFAIPYQDYTYIGTTDTAYDDSINGTYADKSDIHYLLDAANHIFPKHPLQAADVVSTWAGLRPLIYEAGKSLTELSRKDEIFHSKSGLITITGGKLTGYRKMAERVIETIIEEFKKEESKTHPLLHEDALTDLSNVSGSEFKSDDEYRKLLAYSISLGIHLGVNEITMERLFSKYGTNTEQVVAQAEEFKSKYADPYLRLELGALIYGIKQEMVCNLSDYLIRRSSQLYFGREHITKYLNYLAIEMAAELGWNETQKNESIKEFIDEYEAVMAWKK